MPDGTVSTTQKSYSEFRELYEVCSQVYIAVSSCPRACTQTSTPMLLVQDLKKKGVKPVKKFPFPPKENWFWSDADDVVSKRQEAFSDLCGLLVSASEIINRT